MFRNLRDGSNLEQKLKSLVKSFTVQLKNSHILKWNNLKATEK